ncbi:hypothetical protein ACGFYA_09855 [Streptomyces sp. NPDC048305]|uniref:hypothetical protein n=1 Tax=Streptomyces sp. NPDC048305 TaxID=3365532 RepID=UPI0037118004
MGIESDQLVYDYLSRVGDLAQRQQLSSGDRMRLVATLRGEIDRQRGTDGSDSPAVVRRILGRLGEPGEVVAAAAESGADGTSLPTPRTAPAAADEGASAAPRARRGMFRKDTPRKGASPEAGRSGEGEPGAGGPEAGAPVPGWPSANAPHMAGLDQVPTQGGPEWWRVEPGPFGENARGGPGAAGPGTAVPGFVGGLERPELFGAPGAAKTPAPRAPGDPAEPAAAADGKADGKEAAERPAAVPAPRTKLRLRRRPPKAVAGGEVAARPRFSNPMLLLAAALLVAGAVLGSWLALAGGWLLAYSSRKFSRAEAKWVALGLPGVVVGGAFVWLWGRMEGRWGEPLAEGAMGDAMTEAWPVVVRVAAIASALYLAWRARRLPG